MNELWELAREVAGHLGDTWEFREALSGQVYVTLLRTSDGARITIQDNGDRVVMFAYRPADDNEQSYRLHVPEISVAKRRGAAVVAAEAKRRLIPAAEADWKKFQEAEEWRKERDRMRDAVYQHLIGIMPAVHEYPTNGSSTRRFTGKGTPTMFGATAEVSVSEGGDIHIGLSNLTVEEAEGVLRFLAEKGG